MKRVAKYGMPAIVLLVALRVAIGWLFLIEGLYKVNDPDFTAAGYLSQAKGPFAAHFKAMIPDPEGLQRLTEVDDVNGDHYPSPEPVIQAWEGYRDAWVEKLALADPAVVKPEPQKESTEDEPTSAGEPIPSPKPTKESGNTTAEANDGGASFDTTPEPKEDPADMPVKEEGNTAAEAKPDPTAEPAAEAKTFDQIVDEVSGSDDEEEASDQPAAEEKPSEEEAPAEEATEEEAADDKPAVEASATDQDGEEVSKDSDAEKVDEAATKEESKEDAEAAKAEAKVDDAKEAKDEEPAAEAESTEDASAEAEPDAEAAPAKPAAKKKDLALTKEQLNAFEAILQEYKWKLKAMFDDDGSEMVTYLYDLDQLKEAEADTTNQAWFQQERLYKKRQKLAGTARPWLKNIDDWSDEIRVRMHEVLTPEQLAAGEPEVGLVPVDYSEIERASNMVKYGTLVIGILLIVGLATPVACIAGAVFLLSVILAQPALPGLYPPAPPSAGNAIIINKEAIVMLALLMLATTPVGRWGGLDYFVASLFRNAVSHPQQKPAAKKAEAKTVEAPKSDAEKVKS